MSNVGLPELIAETPQRYVEIAVAWASDLTRLAAVRTGLRERLQASALMDGKQFARDLEAVIRRIWTRWCGVTVTRKPGTTSPP
jgi:predicted O-linked N-acetylglucosamine transferase (SPINDLY family)